jgi:thymidylate synthase
MVNAWNVGELDQMVLPPCHYGFQVYTRELSLNERGEAFKKTYPDKSVSDFAPDGIEVQSLSHQLTTRYDNAKIPTRAISLMWNQRSVDTFLGLPFNIASYGLLLTILAKEVNMVPDQLIGNLGDVHLYSNHIEQAKEQIGREPFELPTLNQFPTYEGSRPSIESYVVGDFTLKDYQSHPSIKAPLSN